MPFPFTFKLSVPGLSNPFVRPEQLPPMPGDKLGKVSMQAQSQPKQRLQITRPRPPSSPAPVPMPASRKRGWEPTFASTSRSTTTLASTSGYLDTPAKYREMAERNASADEFHEVEMFADHDGEMPPPAKRRRGLAGSIVSTALSAALIGTAVGLTVYRLWRDRGKEPPRLDDQPQQPPPPPYQQGAWTPSAPLQITPATPTTPRRRRDRHAVTSASAGKRAIAHRRKHVRSPVHHVAHAHGTTTTAPNRFSAPQPEFNFTPEPPAEPMEVEDQMDWIGDKLSMLIEEGKRALNREIVVTSDAQEDEVDDGSGAWEEEFPTSASASSSRAGSIRRSTRRPRSLAPSAHIFSTQGQTHTHHPSLSPSPTKPGFAFAPSTSAPHMTMVSTPQRGYEDEQAWESPEIRESMERARARLLGNRGS
ncbi:hypothetical protein DXG01_001494 [Tephrocybe rancida]|nr:hypothetical protein DXG01_001494 [Tephrocybe rancida]